MAGAEPSRAWPFHLGLVVAAPAGNEPGESSGLAVGWMRHTVCLANEHGASGLICPAMQPTYPTINGVMRKYYPDDKGPLSDIPNTGPAPALMRVDEWMKVCFVVCGCVLGGGGAWRLPQHCLLTAGLGPCLPSGHPHLGVNHAADPGR